MAGGLNFQASADGNFPFGSIVQRAVPSQRSRLHPPTAGTHAGPMGASKTVKPPCAHPGPATSCQGAGRPGAADGPGCRPADGVLARRGAEPAEPARPRDPGDAPGPRWPAGPRATTRATDPPATTSTATAPAAR